MSTSRHPVVLAVERRVGDDARLLAAVMGLPLVDGIFPALVLAGALDTGVGIVQVGLLVFGGSATIAVLLADMAPDPRRQARVVLAVGIPLIALAAVEAALAPAIGSALDLAVFERFAGLVLLTVAAKTASARVGDLLPEPWVVVALGAVASVRLDGVAFAMRADPALVGRAAIAAGVGVAFALFVALVGTRARRLFDLDRFRFGSAVALGVLALAVVGILPGGTPLPLAVLAVTALLSFDPDEEGQEEESDGESGTEPESFVDTERLPWQ